MLDTINVPATEKVTEPSRQWANRYRIDKRTKFRTDAGNTFYRDAGTYDAERAWPSKDVAEHRAGEYMAHIARELRKQGVTCEYLGAFPVSP
jgi:hypothetical protein